MRGRVVCLPTVDPRSWQATYSGEAHAVPRCAGPSSPTATTGGGPCVVTGPRLRAHASSQPSTQVKAFSPAKRPVSSTPSSRTVVLVPFGPPELNLR